VGDHFLKTIKENQRFSALKPVENTRTKDRDMNAVIYARFSSFGQREESIEGQLKICHNFAKEKGLTVISEYIDRATTATNDNRANFQQMIYDSEKGLFDTVIVYQFDRFARNRTDSAIYKSKLKKCGVRVVSATEVIADDPSGIMMEGILETFAEYQSADMARKIKRGQQVNAEKCAYNGGRVPFGYKINKEKHFEVDEDTAPLVRRIFEMYAEGREIKSITEELNSLGIKTQQGKAFSPNSLQKILRNKRYTGSYIYGEIEVVGGIPKIISEELFQSVQRNVATKKKAPLKKDSFLLTTKLFCGHCGSMMIGDSGTSKTRKKKHYYYSCKNARKKACSKKAIKRQLIEDFVVSECRNFLTDENIAIIAKAVAKLSQDESLNIYIKQLKKELKQTEAAIDNLLKAIELGEELSILMPRIKQKRIEKEEIEGRIASEELKNVVFSDSEICFFLTELKNGEINDEKYRKMLVNVLVNEIYLYDDKATIHFNIGGRPAEITLDLQEEVLSDGVRIDETVLHKIARKTAVFCGFCLSTRISSRCSIGNPIPRHPIENWRGLLLETQRRPNDSFASSGRALLFTLQRPSSGLTLALTPMQTTTCLR
jgi:DNA invertase Pin-like site-specific DNA recombinase